MYDRHDVIRYWTGPLGAGRAFPVAAGRWPDPDAMEILRELCRGLICDVGCGTGRCAEAFDPAVYVGIDINPVAVARAKKDWKKHAFYTITWDEIYPMADTYLFYTMLLHVPDSELAGVVAKTARKVGRRRCRVVILESMESSLREMSATKSPVFAWQRDVDEYVEAFAAVGKTRVVEHRRLSSNFRPGFRDFLVIE